MMGLLIMMISLDFYSSLVCVLSLLLLRGRGGGPMDHWRGPGRRRAAGGDMPWYLPWRTCTYPKAQRAACAHPLARRDLFR